MNALQGACKTPESCVVVILHMTAVLKDLVHVVAAFSPAARKHKTVKLVWMQDQPEDESLLTEDGP